MSDSWQSGTPYDLFMGRWSELIARRFLTWLAVPAGRRWLDVGCGTGTLSKIIVETYQPRNVVAVDSSADFVAYARQLLPHPAVHFKVANAEALTVPSNSVEALVSGLMLNFVPRAHLAVSEMLRVTSQGGQIGIFLWDYAEGMEMLRYFWNAAIAVDEAARALDEGVRFPLCRREALESLVLEAGLRQVETTSIVVTTPFNSFEDYWLPFLGNVGPAGNYAMQLSPADRRALQERVHQALPISSDGSILLSAGAWAVKGTA